MANRVISIELTGTNASAVRAIEGTSLAASKAGATVDSKLGGAASKVGGAFSKLDQQLAGFGIPFAGALGALGGKLEQTETKTKSFGSSVSSLGGAELAGAAVGLAVVGASAIRMADTFDQAHARLATAATNVGESMSAEGSAISATDDKLTSLGFKSSDTEAALAALVPATHDVGTATELMGTAADLARFKNESLADATQTLVAIEGGRLKGLASLGISSKDAAGKTIDVATAVQRVTDAVSGQGTAYLDTYAGQQAKLAAEAEKLGVALGETEKKALVDVQKTLLSGVETFQSFNSATDGVLGKVAAVTVALPAAAFAAKKLWAAGGEVVDVFGKIGQGVGSAVSGLGNLVGASGAAAAAETTEATALEIAATAATSKGVAVAALGVAESKEAITSAALGAAREKLAFAQADVGASDAEIVAASKAVDVAQAKEIATTNALVAARERAAVAGGEAVAGSGIGAGVAAGATAEVAAVSPFAAIAAGASIAAFGLGSAWNAMGKSGRQTTVDTKNLTDAVQQHGVTLGQASQQQLTDYISKNEDVQRAMAATGLTASDVSEAIQGNADKWSLVTTRLHENADSAPAVVAGFGDTANASSKLREQVDIMSGAFKRSKLQITSANGVTVDLSRSSADGTKAVGGLTNQVDQNTTSLQKQAAALQATDDQLKHLNDDTLAAANSDLALQQATINVGDAANTYNQKLVALRQAKAGDTQASRDAQSASISLSQSMLSAVSAAEANAKAHVDLTSKANGTALAIDEENAKHAAAKQELDVLAVTYPGLAADIDVYRKTLGLIPAHVSTAVTVDASGALGAIGAVQAGLRGLSSTTEIVAGTKVGFVTHTTARAAGGPAEGLTWVGEKGAELVDLPKGSYVHDATTSRKMAAAAVPTSRPPSFSSPSFSPPSAGVTQNSSSSNVVINQTNHLENTGTTLADIEYLNRLNAWQLTRSGRR